MLELRWVRSMWSAASWQQSSAWTSPIHSLTIEKSRWPRSHNKNASVTCKVLTFRKALWTPSLVSSTPDHNLSIFSMRMKYDLSHDREEPSICVCAVWLSYVIGIFCKSDKFASWFSEPRTCDCPFHSSFPYGIFPSSVPTQVHHQINRIIINVLC